MWLYHFWFFWPNSDWHTGYLCAFTVSALSPSLLSNVLGHFRDKLLLLTFSLSFLRPVPSSFYPWQRPIADITLGIAEPARHGKTVRLLSWQRRALCDNKKSERAARRKPMAVNRLLCPRHKRVIQRGVAPYTKPRTEGGRRGWTDWKGNATQFLEKNKTKHASLWLRLNQRERFLPPRSASGVMILSSSLWLWLSFREKNTHNNSLPYNDKSQVRLQRKQLQADYGNEELWAT